MYDFEFEIGAIVRIHVSDEEGRIVGRAQYEYKDNQYLVRYKNALGIAVEQWWDESAIGEF